MDENTTESDDKSQENSDDVTDDDLVNSTNEEDDDSQLDHKGPYFPLTVVYNMINIECTIHNA